MQMVSIEIEREEDGRWMAEVPNLPRVIAYGQNQDEAISRAEVLALRVLAQRQPTRSWNQEREEWKSGT